MRDAEILAMSLRVPFKRVATLRLRVAAPVQVQPRQRRGTAARKVLASEQALRPVQAARQQRCRAAAGRRPSTMANGL